MKSIQHQNSQRTNSIFTSDVFSITLSNISIIESKETQNGSPQTSRHSTVRQENYLFSKFLDTIRENLVSTDISQKMKHDIQRMLDWFIIDYFVHKIEINSASKKDP